MSTIYLTNDSELSQIANAIRERGGTTESLIYPEGFVSAIENIPGASVNLFAADRIPSESEEGDLWVDLSSIKEPIAMPDSGVVFVDWDGEIIESWKSADVSEKVALPVNPEHERLVADGWNWTLSEIKNYILKYPRAVITVGQMYHTVSSYTEIDIELTKASGLEVSTGFVVTGGDSITVDWGDGIVTEDGTQVHTYEDYGIYTIKVHNGDQISTGSQNIAAIGTCANVARKIFIGEHVQTIGNYFVGNSHVEVITLPSAITSISSHAFYNAHKIKSIVIPRGVTSVAWNLCAYACHLKFCALPAGITYSIYSSGTQSQAFSYCYVLKSFILPDTMKSVPNYIIRYACDIKKIVFPEGLTNIESNAFADTPNIELYDFSACKSVPTIRSTTVLPTSKFTRIVVPDTLYDTWIAASYWTSYANYIYKASEV